LEHGLSNFLEWGTLPWQYGIVPVTLALALLINKMEGQNEQTNDDLISKLKFVFARKNVCLPPSHKL
jgi:hypothetical protein